MEVHDCFSITELVLMEDLGLSDPGRAVHDVLDGRYDRDGVIPCQVDGGLKCFGHPIGATGLRMAYEIYLQLLGRAGDRQLGTPTLLEAPNGQEAVAIYEREKPELVLLDINMPVMDGVETLKRLREINPDCVVVMLTSLATRSHIENAIALGAANYIRKDTPKDEIAKALSETITACFETDAEANP